MPDPKQTRVYEVKVEGEHATPTGRYILFDSDCPLFQYLDTKAATPLGVPCTPDLFEQIKAIVEES